MINFSINGTNFTIDEFEPAKSDLYELDNWQAYKLTETKADFITLKINLEMHGESLEGLHEGYSNCLFCTLCDEIEIANAVIDHTNIYNCLGDYINRVKENYEDGGQDFADSFEEYLADYMTSDCTLMAYEGRIYERIYC